jgi:hypothetical protein
MHPPRDSARRLNWILKRQDPPGGAISAARYVCLSSRNFKTCVSICICYTQSD